MPKRLHRRLLAIALQRGYGKSRTNAYVYGTLAKVDRKRK